MKRLVLLGLSLLLCGCATKYQEMGFFGGGVAAQRMTGDTYRIIARGNAHTGSTAIQDFIMLKAAEVTKQHGGTHFIVLETSDESRVGSVVMPGRATTRVKGNKAETTYTSSTVRQFHLPGRNTYIRVITATENNPAPQNAVLADDIIRFVGSRHL